MTIGIAPAFFNFNRNGLDMEIKFTPNLNDDEVDWAFNLCKGHMEEKYDAAGYGWDDEDKERELTEPGARFLVVTEKGWETPVGNLSCNIYYYFYHYFQSSLLLSAFCHFRFTVQGEVMDVMAGETTLYVWDIHVEEQYQRKGLGKHLLTLCELIAKREKMKFVSIPVMNGDDVATSFIKKSKGYMPDTNLFDLLGFDSNVEGFEVFAKCLDLPKPKPVESHFVVNVETTTSSVFDAKIDQLSKDIGELKVGKQHTDENTTTNSNENEEQIKVDPI